MSEKKPITISLEGMHFFAYHGVYEEEQKIGRDFTVSVFVDCLVDIDGSDELTDTYNYEWIYSIVEQEMKHTRKLLETVAFFIGKGLRAQSSLLESGVVKISKEALVLGGEVDRSTIEYRF